MGKKMLKVMLIGDSIRLGYQEKVMELLADKATISAPKENCRFSAYTLFNLSSWVPDDDYDVIHWNNGQWDTCHMPDGEIHTPLTSYLELQERIAGILTKKARRLIFATTTPVWPDLFTCGHVHPRRNEDIDAYNRGAVNRLPPLGVAINDLNAPLRADIKRFICADRVHLTDAGKDLCAAKVAHAILAK